LLEKILHQAFHSVIRPPIAVAGQVEKPADRVCQSGQADGTILVGAEFQPCQAGERP
jgi:hypothetical protein